MTTAMKHQATKWIGRSVERELDDALRSTSLLTFANTVGAAAGAVVAGFVLIPSIGIERFLSFYGRFRRHLHAVEVASGVLLIVLGGLLVLNRFTIISGYLSFLNRFAL